MTLGWGDGRGFFGGRRGRICQTGRTSRTGRTGRMEYKLLWGFFGLSLVIPAGVEWAGVHNIHLD